MARLRSTNEETIHYSFRKPKGGNVDIAKLTKKTNADKQELSALLQQKAHKAQTERNRRHNETVNLISRALSEPSSATSGSKDRSSDRDFPAYPNTAIALNSSYKSILDVLNASEDLVADFDKIERMITDNGKNSAEQDEAEDWERELQKGQRLVGLGKTRALRDVTRLLGADVEDEDMVDACREDGGKIGTNTDNQVNNLFDYEVNYELQKALRYAERGVKRMAKCLPRDEMEP